MDRVGWGWILELGGLERVKWKRRGEDLGLGYNGGDRG